MFLLIENLDPYEVEEFLADILNAEFDTIADDGSLSEVKSSSHSLSYTFKIKETNRSVC